jgi:hypothetical protein
MEIQATNATDTLPGNQIGINCRIFLTKQLNGDFPLVFKVIKL